MKFGIFDHVDHPGGDLADFYADRMAIVGEYDRAGFHCYHVAEHHGTPLGCAPSPGLYLSAVAQHTSRMLLGPLVYTLPLYHPLRLIDEICMLDQMSRGRLQLGIGRGVSPFELSYFGLSPETAQEMYVEAFDVIRQGLMTRELTFHGTYYHYDRVPIPLTPVQTPHPPLWYGIGRPDSVPWVAQNAVNIVGNLSGPMMRPVTDRFRAEWAALGRAEADLPLMGVSRHIVIADSDAEALALARPAYRRWRESFLVLWLRHNAMPPNPNAIFPETFEEAEATGRAVAGTVSKVRDFLRATIDAGGLNYLLCRFAFGDMPRDAVIASARRFAAEVMPAFTPR